MSGQDQFLDVIDRDEAEVRFRAALALEPLGVETVTLASALGRVLGGDVLARVDVPSFDRSNFDGFALRAADTFGALELSPRRVALLPPTIDAGITANIDVGPGQAVAIATGGMVPRGADAVLMVEHADVQHGEVVVRKAVTPGFGVAFAGNDIAVGEVVLRIGSVLTSRETGVLAAIGEDRVAV
jgi:putative molybdopterin biosynthesis protein